MYDIIHATGLVTASCTGRYSHVNIVLNWIITRRDIHHLFAQEARKLLVRVRSLHKKAHKYSIVGIPNVRKLERKLEMYHSNLRHQDRFMLGEHS